MVQSPANRLLTEAAGAAAYRTAAQVDTQADARIAAKRGAALGIAALGADGIVPAAQLPPISNNGVVKLTQLDRTNGIAQLDDPELIVPGLVAGTYAVELLLRYRTGGQSALLARLAVSAGTLEGELTGVPNNTGALLALYTASNPAPAVLGINPPQSTTNSSSGASVNSSVMLRGMFYLSSAAALSVQWTSPSTNSYSMLPGSALRAVKIG